MSTYAFGIEHYPGEEWLFEFGRCDDGSAYWFTIGPWHFVFGQQLRTASFTPKAALEAIKEWARPALRHLSLPARVAGAALAGVGAVAIGLMADVVLRLQGF